VDRIAAATSEPARGRVEICSLLAPVDEAETEYALEHAGWLQPSEQRHNQFCHHLAPPTEYMSDLPPPRQLLSVRQQRLLCTALDVQYVLR
jgi:hypothetical protein